MASLNKPPEQLLDPRAAAAMLALSPATLATWRCRQRYKLPYVKIGGTKSVRYRLSDVQAFIAKNLVGGEDGNGKRGTR
jgi:predicted DNA-binding transcriptional regulator AlpA